MCNKLQVQCSHWSFTDGDCRKCRSSSRHDNVREMVPVSRLNFGNLNSLEKSIGHKKGAKRRPRPEDQNASSKLVALFNLSNFVYRSP